MPSTAMLRAGALALLALTTGCGSSSSAPATTAGAGGAAGSSAGAAGAGAGGESGAGGAPAGASGSAGASGVTSNSGPWDDAPAPSPPSYFNSLAHCWTDATCQRAMVVSHGGDWGDSPYDSRGALVKAVQRGSDAIKADLRVTADDVAVVTHSSPIQGFESLECSGKKIEEMTAEQVTACHMFGSTTETFQRVSDLLDWAKGRTVVMLNVKVATDIPRAISTGVEAGAQDFLFLEIHWQDFLDHAVGAPGWEQIHFLVQLGPTDVDAALAANHKAQAFMYEMDPAYPGWDSAAIHALVTSKLHPAGVRSFSSTDKNFPTVENHQALFDEGFDVVMTYNLTNALAVRTSVNTARGVSPP